MCLCCMYVCSFLSVYLVGVVSGKSGQPQGKGCLCSLLAVEVDSWERDQKLGSPIAAKQDS